MKRFLIILLIMLTALTVSVDAQTVSSVVFNAGSTTISGKVISTSIIGNSFININSSSQKELLTTSLVIQSTETETQKFISLYPNPNTGIVYFTVKASTMNDFIEIFDINGISQKKVYLNKLSSGTIHIENLNRGIYFMKFYRNNKTQTIKIIKN